MTTNEEFKAAVFAAKRAFSMWRNTPISTRQWIMFKFQELIRRDIVFIWNCYLHIFIKKNYLYNNQVADYYFSGLQ